MKTYEAENRILRDIVQTDTSLARQFAKFQGHIEQIGQDQRRYPTVGIENGDGVSKIAFSGRNYLMLPKLTSNGPAIVFIKLKNNQLPGSEDQEVAVYDFDAQGFFQSLGAPEGIDKVLNLNSDIDCICVVQHTLISTAFD